MTKHSHGYTAKVILRKDKVRKDGTAPFSLQAFINGDRVVIPLHLYARPEDWDQQEGKILATGKDADIKDDTNILISNAASRAARIFLNYRLKDMPLSISQFREEFSQSISSADFLEYWAKAIDRERPLRAPKTVIRYEVHLNRLRNFRANIYFNELTPGFLIELEGWLKGKWGLDVNTIASYHKTIKKFIRLAEMDGYRFDNPYRYHKIRKAKTERSALCQDELKQLLQIYRQDLLSDSEHNVLEYFLFSCFTGLRYSDVEGLTDENIVGDMLVFRPQKTSGSKMLHKVPLNPVSKEILKGKCGRIFRVISTQKTNVILRQVLNRIEVNKHYSFHCGRHTYATTLLNLGVQAAQVKKWMGIIKWDTFEVYVHMADEMKEKDQELFNEFLA